MKRILVPVDGSSLSYRAVPYAAALATATGARLLLVRAALARPFFDRDAAVAQMAAVGEAESELHALVGRLSADGLAVESRVAYGAAASSILDAAAADRADLIVMSTHGRGGLGRWIYGSVADRVLRRAEVPVLVVPPGSGGAWGADEPLRLVVPLDGSELAEAVLGPACELAAALGATLVLVRVVEPVHDAYAYGGAYGVLVPDVDPDVALAAARAYLAGVAERLRGVTGAVETEAAVGPAAATIVAVARGAHAVALATHGRSGLARLVMGSVAASVLQHADVPVLLVRPTALGQPAVERPVATATPAATPGTSQEPPRQVALTALERHLVEYGLELLLHATDRDDRSTEPIAELIARVRHAPPVPGERLPTGVGGG